MTSKAFGLAQLGNAYSDGALSNRNKIINGAMVIDQRNAGASVTPTEGQYTVDRWQARLNQSSKFSVQQNAGAVTPPDGYTKYLGVTSLSSYSPAASDYFGIVQNIEGFNAADLGWGTANAQSVTLSFWVRSSLTGTFTIAFINDGYSRGYVATYTINAANTWEQKTITLSGDTTGTWQSGNSAGIRVWFTLGFGSSQITTPNVWGSFVGMGATGAVSVVGTSGATFYLTGVQLEAGDTATPFEHRSYGQELALCQRYYEVGQDGIFAQTSGAFLYCVARFSTTKRVAPTMVSTGTFISGAAAGTTFSNIVVDGFGLGNIDVCAAAIWTASAEL
jgi:hypothetical protein